MDEALCPRAAKFGIRVIRKTREPRSCLTEKRRSGSPEASALLSAFRHVFEPIQQNQIDSAVGQ